jgi:predicted MFS family arabinose efflux permease
MGIEVLSPSQRRIILLLSFAGFSSSVNLRVTDALLPSLSQQFGISIGEASAAISSYAIGLGLFQLVMGVFGDRFGKFRMIVILCGFSAAASFAASLAGSIGQLVAIRFVGGILAAGIIPLGLAWCGDNAPMEVRQEVMARYVTGNITGVLLGPAVGGLLAQYFGWTSAFSVLAVVFLAVSAALFLFGGKDALRRLPAEQGNNLLANLGGLRKSRYAWGVLLGLTVEGTAIFGVLAFTAATLHERFAVSLGVAGLLVAFFAVGGLVYSFTASRLLMRFTGSQLMAVGGVVCGAGLIALGLCPLLWLAPVCIVTLGFGFYLVHGSLQVHSTQILPGARGTGVAIGASFLLLSQSLGVFLAAPVVDRWGLLPACAAAAVMIAGAGLWLAARLPAR